MLITCNSLISALTLTACFSGGLAQIGARSVGGLGAGGTNAACATGAAGGGEWAQPTRLAARKMAIGTRMRISSGGQGGNGANREYVEVNRQRVNMQPCR